MKLLGFLDDRMVFGLGESDGGNPILHVWSLTGALPGDRWAPAAAGT